MYRRLIYLEGIGLFKFESLSKILISSASASFIVENWDNIWCSFMHFKKSVMRLQITAFKIATNGHQYTKTTEDKKFIFWINAHTPIKEQSNQDWNISIYISIHLKGNGWHIKVALIFWFLIMIFYLCFYHQLWVKWVCIEK